MVPQLIARVDGLPVSLLARQVIWPAPDTGPGRCAEVLPAHRRARIERQTAGVHQCRLPRWALALAAAEQAEAERLAIRAELGAAGLL